MTALRLYSRPRKARRYPERQLQELVCDMLRLYAVPKLIWFAVPNEGKRERRTGAFLKRMGMLPGVADLVLFLPSRIHLGERLLPFPACLELKAGRGIQSPAQIAFEAQCGAAGVPYEVVRTPEEAAATLFRWGALTENPLARPNRPDAVQARARAAKLVEGEAA